MEETDVIIRELDAEEIKRREPFSHFGWEGKGPFSFFTISEGFLDGARVIYEKMKSEKGNFSVVDSLIYPLFFNYRHSVETFLKLLFFELGGKTDKERQDFLEKGHNLESLWMSLRPILDKGKKHVGLSVNLKAVDHYIKSINQFDPDSMVMRYPVTKDLTETKAKEYHFDYVNFHDRMEDLCKDLRTIEYELSNQMHQEATFEQLNDYLDIFEIHKETVKHFLQIVESEDINDEPFDIKDFIKNLKNRRISEKDKFLHTCEPDVLILLDNLYYGGRAVKSEEVHLSNSPVTRQKEFVKLLYNLLNQDGLCFGEAPKDDQINIFEKSSDALLEYIKTAVSIMELSY